MKLRTRILIFIAMVAAAMAIIIGVASVSHASECLPSARAVWAAHNGAHATWNVVDDVKCYRVGYGRHHRKEVMRPVRSSTKNRHADARPRSANLPAGAVHWQNPEHAKLFDEFQDWYYLGKR